MQIETGSELPTYEILRSYSGRRLQYAIKVGLLPTPESLNQVLKRKLRSVNRVEKRVMA